MSEVETGLVEDHDPTKDEPLSPEDIRALDQFVDNADISESGPYDDDADVDMDSLVEEDDEDCEDCK